MISGHRASLRTIATGSVLGLAAGTAAVLGTTTTAAAVPLSFDCNVPVVGQQTFATDIASNAPAQLPTGSPASPTMTALLTVPANLADLMRSVLSTDEIAGEIVSQTTVGGVVVPTTLAIPRTDIGDSGEVVLTATGAMSPFTAGTPGDVIEILAGAQDVNMTLFDLEGDPAGAPFAIPCTPTSGQDPTIGNVEVVKADSRTKVAPSYNAKQDKAAGKATVLAANGIPATGKVKFVLKKGAREVASATTMLRGGRAAVVFTKVRKAGRYTLVASYLGSTRVKPSTGKGGFGVR